ncbi:MAG: MBL fold metallo-hydrolase [Candidatus Aminicenantes bacterium]|nr:MBL fold metallo-hydrolase [Candidatus Aminicenantes bacterium]
MMMNIRFLGASRQVTGSKFLLETDDRLLLVDCGLYQERALLHRNWDRFPVPPGDIEAVLLTHAHLDHCGYIPRLAADGFKGRILATAPTVELARIILLDSAHIQEEDAAFKKKRHAKEGRTGPHPEIPLYTIADAEESLPLFEPVAYGKRIAVGRRTSVTFHDAGHILGSAMIEVEAGEGSDVRRILFSGDIGRYDNPLVRDPARHIGTDYLVMESTYGDREHDDEAPVDEILARIIGETAGRGGKVVVPVFAMERAQELLYILGILRRAGRIPNIPVFLDSPMAVEVTQVFTRYPSYMDEEAGKILRSGHRLFEFPGLRPTPTAADSKAINAVAGPAVILAGSGMVTGGRIKHHLKQTIGRPETTVLFVGFQAQGTLGRTILDGAQEVRILGETLPVRARIVRIGGFSAHAGKNELLRWLRGFERRPRRLFLCHGEEGASLSLAEELKKDGWKTVVPRYGDEFELT